MRLRFSEGQVSFLPYFFILCAAIVLGLQAVDAPQQPVFRFSHRVHVIEEEMECDDCHEAAETSIRGQDNLFPDPESCLDCHEPDEFDPFDRLPLIETYSRKFSHQQHLESGETCESCHAELRSKEVALPYLLPDMVACLNCHQVHTVSFDCYSCHMEFEKLTPISHTRNFRHTHGDLARMEAVEFSNGKDCATCHQARFCQTCHEGDNLDRLTHPLNFEFTHALEAQNREAECAVCHTRREFCITCHRDNNVLPHNHTVGWVNNFPNDGGRHRVEALNDPEACMSCHEHNAEQLCQRCHGR